LALAALNAGNNSEARMEMMAITTSNSIRVKAVAERAAIRGVRLSAGRCAN
jgi:hypothetical protein